MTAPPARRRPGRPPALESKDRLDDIVRAARSRFAAEGFDAATLSNIATDAHITLAALYHYVDTKFALYEMVFRRSLSWTWDRIMNELEAADGETLAERMTTMLGAIHTENDDHRAFLAAAPIEAKRHPELAHLLAERDRARERAYRWIVAPLHDDGRLDHLGSLEDAVDMVRVAFSGWSFESHLRPDQRDANARGVIRIAALMDGDAKLSVRVPARASRRTTSRPR